MKAKTVITAMLLVLGLGIGSQVLATTVKAYDRTRDGVLTLQNVPGGPDSFLVVDSRLGIKGRPILIDDKTGIVYVSPTYKSLKKLDFNKAGDTRSISRINYRDGNTVINNSTQFPYDYIQIATFNTDGTVDLHHAYSAGVKEVDIIKHVKKVRHHGKVHYKVWYTGNVTNIDHTVKPLRIVPI